MAIGRRELIQRLRLLQSGPQHPDRVIARDALERPFSLRAAITTKRPLFVSGVRPAAARRTGEYSNHEDRELRERLVMRARMVREAQEGSRR